jgi:hypothetical protein
MRLLWGTYSTFKGVNRKLHVVLRLRAHVYMTWDLQTVQDRFQKRSRAP